MVRFTSSEIQGAGGRMISLVTNGAHAFKDFVMTPVRILTWELTSFVFKILFSVETSSSSRLQKISWE